MYIYSSKKSLFPPKDRNICLKKFGNFVNYGENLSKMPVFPHTDIEEYTVMAYGLFSQPVEPLGSFKVRKENPRGKILQPCQYDLNSFYC